MIDTDSKIFFERNTSDIQGTQSEAFQVCFIVEPEEELFLKQSNKRVKQFASDHSQFEVSYRVSEINMTIFAATRSTIVNALKNNANGYANGRLIAHYIIQMYYYYHHCYIIIICYCHHYHSACNFVP